MTRRVARFLALFALLAVLASSCFGGGEPEPLAEDATPSPRTASPTATATPAAVTASPTATPIGALTPTAAPAPTAAPTPTAAPAPTAAPTPTVQGPLLVLSERVGDAPPREGSEVETRRVLIYDLADDRYWAAFEYRNPRTRIRRGGHMERSAVQPAGTDLVVWSGDQVRRMSLDGETQTILFEDNAIRAIKVSPDGSKVAVMQGEPGTLVVLDVSSGDRLLRVPSDHPDLGSLRYGGRYSRLALGNWRDDGSALSITASDHSGPQAHTAVLRLSGGIHALAEELVVSPNLRYAIQFGEVIESASARTWHQPVWRSLAVLDVETGRVAWTIEDEGGLQSSLDYGPWLGPYVTLNLGGTRLLDTATGEIVPRTTGIERQVEGPVRSTCEDTYRRAYACYVQHDGRVVWDSADGWAHYLGLIETPDGLELHGVEPVGVAREVLPPPPPARDEMVGPLLAYEVHGDYEYYRDGGRAEPRATRRVIIRDEGTGRSWLAFTYLNSFAFDYARGAAQPALGGLVAAPGQQLVHLAPDGQPRILLERSPGAFSVSPDGRKMAASFYRSVAVLTIPSGEEILRLADDDIASALGLSLSGELHYWSVSLGGWGEHVWTSDSEAILLLLTDGDGYDGRVYGVLATPDGEVRLACVTDYNSGSDEALSCLSPDGRYAARGRRAGSSDYVSGNWGSFDIIELATGSVLHSADGVSIWQSWLWASPDHFAWPTEPGSSSSLESLRRDGGADISVLDVTTGEIHVMDSGDYLARFYPPPRASIDCPEHPAHPCRILLGGEVVGEGRWPRIIGFIEIE